MPEGRRQMGRSLLAPPSLFAFVAVVQALGAARDVHACSPLVEAAVSDFLPWDGRMDIPLDVHPRARVLVPDSSTTVVVTLWRGATAVPSTEILESEPANADDWPATWHVLVPDALLVPRTSYRVVVTIEYDPASGLPDPPPAEATFTTGAALAPTPPPGPRLARVSGDFFLGQEESCLVGGADYLQLSLELEPLQSFAEGVARWLVSGRPPPWIFVGYAPAKPGVRCFSVVAENLAGAVGAPGEQCCVFIPAPCDDDVHDCRFESTDFSRACGDVTPAPPVDGGTDSDAAAASDASSEPAPAAPSCSCRIGSGAASVPPATAGLVAGLAFLAFAAGSRRRGSTWSLSMAVRTRRAPAPSRSSRPRTTRRRRR